MAFAYSLPSKFPVSENIASAGEWKRRDKIMWRNGRASDEEGLRLMLAFFTIDDPAKRRQLIELAESFSSGEAPSLTKGALSLVQDNMRSKTRADPQPTASDPFKP
jgi:hypothetical protein